MKTTSISDLKARLRTWVPSPPACQLATVTARWNEVERQYEALHREMLLTLEQRDDARRLLDNERAERDRLSRALQSRR